MDSLVHDTVHGFGICRGLVYLRVCLLQQLLQPANVAVNIGLANRLIHLELIELLAFLCELYTLLRRSVRLNIHRYLSFPFDPFAKVHVWKL